MDLGHPRGMRRLKSASPEIISRFNLCWTARRALKSHATCAFLIPRLRRRGDSRFIPAKEGGKGRGKRSLELFNCSSNCTNGYAGQGFLSRSRVVTCSHFPFSFRAKVNRTNQKPTWTSGKSNSEIGDPVGEFRHWN